MPRYRLDLEYDGAPFVGWQRQDVGRSAQGDLERALAALGERGPADAAGEGGGPVVVGAGRTDAGVHALGQVAHTDLVRDWDPFRLSEALNHHLKPAPIAVLAAARAADAFHARFDAVERRYLYRIAIRRAPLTLDRGKAWRVGYPLDADAMRRAAAALIGRRDFTTFRSVQCQARSPVKTLDAIEVHETEEGVAFRLRAPSFLHNQVRSIVGTLERVGAGRWPEARVAEALVARRRSACGPVAPPHGLYLAAVRYPEDG